MRSSKPLITGRRRPCRCLARKRSAAEFREHCLVIAEYQQDDLWNCAGSGSDAFFSHRRWTKCSRFRRTARSSRGPARLAELEVVGVAFDAVLIEDQRDDFRRRHLLVDALVGAVAQVLQLWHQGIVAGQAFAGIALAMR